MASQNKVNLSGVNKSKKTRGTSKKPALQKSVKKQTSGPARDAEGKFTSGSGGLFSTKSFKWSRVLPIVGVVAVVGGYLVYQSLAATPNRLVNYQYNAKTCDKYSYATVVGPVTEGLAGCRNRSAEAFVYRLYRANFNRVPDAGGYKYWTEKLVKDRRSTTQVAKLFLGNNKDSNEEFVNKLYKNLLKRKPDENGKKYWVDQLSSKKWNKQKVITHFVASKEAITVQHKAVATWLRNSSR